MIQYIYSSTPSEDFQISALYDLLEKSRAFNARHDISGVLMFTSGYFMQALEGSAAQVLDLARKIQADPRHRGFTLMGQAQIESRTWSNWGMGLIMPNQQSHEVIHNHCGDEFAPHQLSLEAAHALLRDLTELGVETC